MLKKNLVSSVLTQIPLFIFGVLTGVFSTRILGDEGKGVVALFQANSQFFVMLLSLGIQTGIVYFISGKKIPQKIVIGMSVFIFAIASILLLVIFFFLHLLNYAEIILPASYTSWFYLLCLFCMFALTFFVSTLSGFFQAYSQFVLLNWISVAISLFNLLVFGALFFFLPAIESTRERVDIVLLTLIASYLLNALILLFFQRKKLNLSFGISFKFKKHFKPFVLYNFSVYFGMFINFFNYRLDLWIINAYLDKKELSYYSLAANIIQIMLFIAVAMAAVLLPNLAAKSEEDRRETFVKVSRISFSFFLFLVTISFLLSSVVIPFLYGRAFSPTILPFQILLPGALFACMNQLFFNFVLAYEKNALNITACTLGLFVTCIGGFFLIPLWGIEGASIVTSASYGVTFIISCIFILRLGRIKIQQLFFIQSSDFNYFLNKIRQKDEGRRN